MWRYHNKLLQHAAIAIIKKFHMKKRLKVILFGVVAAFALSPGAYAWMYNTSCGIAVQTVSPDSFDDPAERDAFYADLENIYCKDHPASWKWPKPTNSWSAALI